MLFPALASAAAAHAAEGDALPATIGIVGVGTIGSAVARGLLGAPEGLLPHTPEFVLSPRNAEKAAALEKEFPDLVRIADSDQGVVDSVDCVVLALPGSVADSVVGSLKFRQGQQVVSLIAAITLARLRELLGPSVDAALALPGPSVAKRQGATLGMPPKPFAEAIFSPLGKYVAVEDEEEFKALSVVGALMGDFYKRQLTVQTWLAAHGVKADAAASWVGAKFAAFASDSKDATPSTFAEKVAEQTPGGLNEMVWKQQDAAGVYEGLNKSMDAVYNVAFLAARASATSSAIVV